MLSPSPGLAVPGALTPVTSEGPASAPLVSGGFCRGFCDGFCGGSVSGSAAGSVVVSMVGSVAGSVSGSVVGFRGGFRGGLRGVFSWLVNPPRPRGGPAGLDELTLRQLLVWKEKEQNRGRKSGGQDSH